MVVRKVLVPEERPICNAVNVFRERGNYLQRLELFEKAIQAYNEALRWNSCDVKSLLGRSTARAKATYYTGALADAARAAELEPQNLTALQIKAQTEYEKCAFEKALLLAHRGRIVRRFPHDFAECARHAEETVRECVGKTSRKVFSAAASIRALRLVNVKEETVDDDAPSVPQRKSRMQPQPTHAVQEISRAEKQRFEQISRLMASQYLERMAHDKYFLKRLCKDERLVSANKQGSKKLQELADTALADIEERQMVLRERRPLYAARASEAAAKARLQSTRNAQIKRAQKQHITDANRLIKAAQAAFEERDTKKCLEVAEFGLEQISRKYSNLLPGKEKFMQQLYDVVAEAFLDQKRFRDGKSEVDRDKRAFILLGLSISREPSRDSVLRVRPHAPRDPKRRLRTLERVLATSTRTGERCYLFHELARLYVDTKQALRARLFALKCQSEARASNHHTWLLNASFLLARCHLLQNNRPEARAVLIEGATSAKAFGLYDIASFFDTCVDISMEGEVTVAEAAIGKREKAMVNLMQGDDLRSEAEHLFRRMSVMPVARRFSIMPGTKLEESVIPSNRRASIAPKSLQPARMTYKSNQPLGLQEFDI